jgi:hypothetical protein
VNIIGENVRRLRKIHDLNQIEFSRLIGCSLEWLLKGNSTHVSEQSSDEMSIWKELWKGSIVKKLLRHARHMDVLVVADYDRMQVTQEPFG